MRRISFPVAKTNIGGATSIPRKSAMKICKGQNLNKTKRQIKPNTDTNLIFLFIIYLPMIFNDTRAI